tara:strand:- start:22051 stop:24735 length:2685 start_codon:yes stop_codon:yes gene_type:complete
MKKSILKLVLGTFFSVISVVAFAQTYTFTNCGATGRFGPTQAQVNATYTGANPLTGNVVINTQGIQEWTVPANGIYRINVTGAVGGNSIWGTTRFGGTGANMQGDFNLTAGQVVSIIVGQAGETDAVGGGGGGSFVAILNVPYIVAGGGGGASSDQNGVAAVVVQNGTFDSQNIISGGLGGNGGNACLVNENNAGGGGGFSTNGLDATSGVNYGRGGLSFLNGGVGGIDGRMDNACNQDAEGGFGGGGSTTCNTVGGGGGGGYSGGAGGPHIGNCGAAQRSGGGGGGSFNNGTNQVNTAGVGTGHGQVVITLLCPSSAPTITCPANIVVNNDAGNCSAVVNYTPPSNPCATTVTQTAGLPSGSAFPVGITTNTFQATNAFGSTTCSFTVTVVDNENPTITCPSATTINTDAGQCTSTASIGTATGTDNCGTPTITNDAPASFPIGNTTVTWTSTDGAGNFVTCTQVVTVVDNEAPVITCPNDTVVGNTPGLCGAVVNYTAPVGTDNCTGATTVLVSGLASGSTFPVGITTVVYAVVDGNNNGDTCSFNVTIADSLAPTAVCQDITIYLDNTGNVNILGTDVDGGSSDDCVIDTLTLSQYNFTCSAIGTNNVTLYVTDTYGNIDSCTAIVTVMDTVVPTVMCQNINVYVDNAGNVSITPNDIDGGSSDMCGISAITASQTTFTCAELGLNNITLYVEDNNGNIDSCVAQVTVYDTIAPAITCPTNQEVSTDNTCMYEIEDYTSMATSSLDNCDMNNVIITQIPAAGSFITADNIINDKGQTVVSIIVEDLSGNADTCEFIVNVTCIDALTIPNVFTPNGDGKNDLWNIAGKENYPDMKVKVFNRWGDLMFESGTGYETPWDGKYNNAEAPAATYYYVIMLGNDEEDLSGTINIVR